MSSLLLTGLLNLDPTLPATGNVGSVFISNWSELSDQSQERVMGFLDQFQGLHRGMTVQGTTAVIAVIPRLGEMAQLHSERVVQYATNRLIDSVWTLAYYHNTDGSIEIISYDRDNSIGYDHERELPQVILCESEGRIVTSVNLRSYKQFGWDEEYPITATVSNPQFIFSYTKES